MPSDSWKLAPGVNHVGAYQVSGRPFASASCQLLLFNLCRFNRDTLMSILLDNVFFV